MSTRLYPLFQKGNPQLRIFLPNFWMKVIRPKEPIPPNMVLFQTSIQMTDNDITNYLKKIYKIPVVEVRTTIKQGLIRYAYGKRYLVKDNDYKEALITLPRDYKFTYPDFVTEDMESQEETVRDDVQKEVQNMTKKYRKEVDVPTWFLN